MAIGFIPNYTQDMALDGLTPNQFLAICLTTARALHWDVRYISDTGLIALTDKRMFRRKQEVNVRISADLATIKSESLGNEMTDWGRNKKNIQQFIDLLAENRITISAEQLDQTYEELKPRLVPPEQDVLSMPPATTKEKWGNFFSLFTPRKGYFITPLLIDLNIAVFIFMVMCGANFLEPNTHNLISWGANVRYLTLGGQWWRITTCCFIHIGIFHLLLNMYALLYIGILLEPQLGRRRFASAYLLTGIMASLASLYWHENTLSAGASGAIFGMYGVFLALLTTNLIDKGRRTALLTSIGIFVAYNLFYGANGSIDNAAHIGGLVSGVVIGYFYYPGLKNPAKPSLLYSPIAVAAFLVIAVCFLAFKKIPNTYGLFDQKMRAFARYEKKALAVTHGLDSDSPKEVWFHALGDSGIYYWNQCIQVINEARQLKVSDELKDRSDALIEYCDLRIQSYNYYYKKIAGTTSPGMDSMTYYNSRITDLMENLKNRK